MGPPGSGKTHLLTAVCNALLSRNVSVHYFPWVGGSNDLRDAIRDGSETIHTLINRMKAVDALYIDDLFKGRKEPTPFQLEFLFDVINDRYLNHKAIMISSERDIEQLCDIDEGIGSRIYEMCKDYTVIMRLTAQEQDLVLNYRLVP